MCEYHQMNFKCCPLGTRIGQEHQEDWPIIVDKMSHARRPKRIVIPMFRIMGKPWRSERLQKCHVSSGSPWLVILYTC